MVVKTPKQWEQVREELEEKLGTTLNGWDEVLNDQVEKIKEELQAQAQVYLIDATKNK